MGRKTAASVAKGKEKRLQRKEEQQRLREAKALVEKANSIENPLQDFPVFQKYNKNGLTADIIYKKSSDLDETERTWVLNLTRRNMQLKYEACSWNWNDTKKSEELYDEAARFLIAKSTEDGSYLGFSHFRFDMEEGIEVLYCYELQLESIIQRKGLGKFLMQVLELMAFKNNMKKVVLTVLKHNPHSKFFRAVGYEVDDISPSDDEEETYPYEILSKVNKRLAQTLPAPVISKAHSHSHSNGHCCTGHHHH
ncbi:N-alpha-acetyltransferase 40 [Sitophilus oryzae]|uniref:N-alpha-acetyltransferase 40 n=1 Tax=Sitophilus oryzae TaxID=7048 RepID=A0A6J2Y6R5_SITOR|nr:N-alpha-acetyltransferase 40 [Sitophilus oryzae]